jgi:4-amino-4-deoxychorismate lyase
MLLETFKIKNGVIYNLRLHNERIKRSRKMIFGIDLQEDISLLPEINNIPVSEKIIKARIIYNQQIQSVEWEYYNRRVISSLKIVEDNDIDYAFKFSDRSRINRLFSLREGCDDIIIVKDGRLTDSSYSNLAFYDGRKWVTPSTPLLAGTKRKQLIMEGKLAEEDLRVHDLKLFKVCSLINALNDLGEMEVRLGDIEIG